MPRERTSPSPDRIPAHDLFDFGPIVLWGCSLGNFRIPKLGLRTPDIPASPFTTHLGGHIRSRGGQVRLWIGRKDRAQISRHLGQKRHFAKDHGIRRDGFATLGATLVIFTFSLGTALWFEILHIRAIAERQIALDRCAGAAGLKLKHSLEVLDASMERLERAATHLLPFLVKNGTPIERERYQQAVLAEHQLQRAVQSFWKAEEKRWNLEAGLGCKIRNHPDRTPFPPFGRQDQPIRLAIHVAQLSTEVTLSRKGPHDWWAQWSK